jgi:hypothetical protein
MLTMPMMVQRFMGLFGEDPEISEQKKEKVLTMTDNKIFMLPVGIIPKRYVSMWIRFRIGVSIKG